MADALIALGSAVVAPTVAASAGPVGVTQVGVASTSALPEDVTLAQLHSMGASHSVTVFEAGAASPATGVPSGYQLLKLGVRRNDYIYDSNADTHSNYACPSNGGKCTLEAQTSVQEHQYVRGGSSKYWELKENARTVQNPASISWRYSAIYYCGVNIPGGPDHTCGNGADASGTSAPMTPGENVAKRFENVNGNTVYPMVGISTHFSTGVTVTTKYRDWDTLNRSTTTKLNTTTGTGE